MQRRRARARIHDKYKAAVGVILCRKGRWPQSRAPGRHRPDAILVNSGRQAHT